MVDARHRLLASVRSYVQFASSRGRRRQGLIERRLVVYYDEEGVGEAASELKVQHLPEVRKNEFGTPLISSVFEHAAGTSSTPIVCFVNADVMLPEQLVSFCRDIDMGAFLLVGQRWDLDVKA